MNFIFSFFTDSRYLSQRPNSLQIACKAQSCGVLYLHYQIRCDVILEYFCRTPRRLQMHKSSQHLKFSTVCPMELPLWPIYTVVHESLDIRYLAYIYDNFAVFVRQHVQPLLKRRGRCVNVTGRRLEHFK